MNNHLIIKSKLTVGHVAFNKKPSKKTIKAVKVLMDLAFTELKKQPKNKKK